jgi:hypothetical protein
MYKVGRDKWDERTIFTGPLFSASLRCYGDKPDRVPYIQIYDNEEEKNDVCELNHIMGNTTVTFYPKYGRQNSVVKLSIMEPLMKFIDFIMYEVRKNNNLLDISKIE